LGIQTSAMTRNPKPSQISCKPFPNRDKQIWVQSAFLRKALKLHSAHYAFG
jgi:hypothetical protein